MDTNITTQAEYKVDSIVSIRPTRKPSADLTRSAVSSAVQISKAEEDGITSAGINVQKAPEPQPEE